MEVTAQEAAKILGCSRQFLIKLLKEDKIECAHVGEYRKIKFEDVLKYRQQMKKEQKRHLLDIMNFDKDIGLYDSE